MLTEARDGAGIKWLKQVMGNQWELRAMLLIPESGMCTRIFFFLSSDRLLTMNPNERRKVR